METQLPQADTNKIGERLQKEYGGSADVNTHIQYFYIRLGKEITNTSSIQCQKQIIEILNKNLGSKYCIPTPGWEDIVFFKCQTIGNQREQEKFINEIIRERIKLIESSVPIHVIISRACLYIEDSTYKLGDTAITTDEIGKIMDNVYMKQDPGNTHIEYFYLFVQASIISEKLLHTNALEVLEELPGNWKSVDAQKTWGGTFFGFFPKQMQVMTEREREKLLNGEVRMPLIEGLKEKLLPVVKSLNDKVMEVTGTAGTPLTVKVIITRACKYTKTE